MAQMLSLTFFLTLLVGCLGLLVAMVRTHAHEIVTALGLEPASVLTTLPARPARRIRSARVIVRRVRFSAQPAYRAAA